MTEKDKYAGLREKLEELSFPTKYMYKFITIEEKIAELRPYFEDAEISTKRSSKGKYISFSAIVMALSADQIIEKYKSLDHIQGLMSL